jgi:hypothetical protein
MSERLKRIRRDTAAALKRRQEGKMGYILAWLLGVPIPILILVYLLRGCN